MGVSCQIRGAEKASPNPSRSFLKAANVAFEEIILVGRRMELGHYESLRDTYVVSPGPETGGRSLDARRGGLRRRQDQDSPSSYLCFVFLLP